MSNFEIEAERYELHASPTYNFSPHRRGFLKSIGGGLVVLLSLNAQESGRRGSGNATPQNLGAWLHIAQSGAITVYTGKAEVGQNIRTSLAQAVAEELHVDPSTITLVMGDTQLTPYDMGTFGSRTTPIMAPQLHKVAAEAREMLLDLAAAQWKLDRKLLSIRDGRVQNPAGASLTFGALTKGQQLTRTITADIAVTPATEWKVAGHDLRKLNARSIVTGKEKYTSDLKLPGMVYGRVVRPPAFRAQLLTADLDAAKQMPGVAAVRDGDFLGVTCSDAAQLEAASAAVKATWKTTPQPKSSELFSWLKTHPAAAIEWKPSEADIHTEATYTLPYIAHVPLETRAAVAQWEGDALTVWTGTQVPFGVRAELADAFKIPEEKVRVIVPPTGSGYGGKHSGECAVEAARLAKAAGKPVKLQWTREEEFTWAYFRPAGVIDVRAGARKDGTILDWQFHNFNSGGAALRSPYNIPNQIAVFHQADSPLRQGSYRGLAAAANHFARESHMDELARAIGMEPAAFRFKNATDPRLRAVIEAATERFHWGQAKSRPGQGFGMMAGLDKGGYVSACVEITVTNNQVRVDRIVQSFECGAIVNPLQLKSQIVGGAIMGLGGALLEQIDFDNGRILNPKLSQYRVPRFGDVPLIDVVLVDRKDLPSAGAGETPIVAIAPAIANAIFDATGKRLRAMPLKL
ncbi:xanthine dehydrogenase family protein molybdopterin-binding subunit [Bryobacter aggregatus]|uniref:xanthine dehydrogenase family protein molybdopterin-binding subunit n=1 Tax=Bryobacter aggregatus TaxID=360054 RepID=UPI0004E1E45A|nr:xanthine dehydrogenase family protein [Bryobacter aggregatus]